jgi:hypothetical protein
MPPFLYLRSVGVLTSIGHGDDSRAGVMKVEVLIFKLSAIDRLSSSAVAIGEVALFQVVKCPLKDCQSEQNDVPEW